MKKRIKRPMSKKAQEASDNTSDAINGLLNMPVKRWEPLPEDVVELREGELGGRVSITNPQGASESWIEISIEDRNSGVEFLEIRMTYENFAKALCSRSQIPMAFSTRGLDKIGKKHECKTFEFEVPETTRWAGNRKDVAYQIAEEKCPEGWIPDSYFSSQESFFDKDGKSYARCTIRRWV